MKYANSSRREGVSYRPWAERVMALLKENGVPEPKTNLMHEMYNDNFTYEEAMLKCKLMAGIKSVRMEFFIKYEGGEYATTFHTDESAKDFFKKFPEAREKLTMEPPKYVHRRR